MRGQKSLQFKFTNEFELTSAMMTFPSFQSFPILHDFRSFFLFFCGCVLEGLFCLFIRVSLTIAAHQTRLKGRGGSETSVLPEEDGALVIGAGEHAAQVVPADAIHWAIVSCEHG